jgi:hypothetical protein
MHISPGGRRGSRALLPLGLVLTAITAGAVAAAPASSQADISAFVDDTFPEAVVDDSPECGGAGHEPVAYRHDRIVLRTTRTNAQAAALVTTALNALYGGGAASWVSAVERISFPTPPAGPAIVPVLSVTLAPRPGGAEHDVVRLARRLRNDPGMEASPDYVLSPAGPYSFFWPNGYPVPVAALTPPRANLTPGGQPIGTGVKIEVYDTGLAPGVPGQLPQTTMYSSLDDEIVDRPNDADTRVDYPYAGHGRAIAGVIRTVAPGSAVEQVRISDRRGLATDASAASRTAATLRGLQQAAWPDVIVNAFGTGACVIDPVTGGGDLEPVGLRAVAEAIDRWDPHRPDGMVVVASAGNVASDRPHYPAAFDTVIGVGALDGTLDGDGQPWTIPARTGAAAAFSNHGDWVDAWVPGVGLPTTHVTGVSFEDGGRIIDGMAAVDGTSFAAPALAAMIAELVSTTALDARGAWAELERGGTAPLPPCGDGGSWSSGGVAVALSSMTAAASAAASGSPVTC